MNGQIYNVGSNEQNYQVLALAESTAKALGINYEIDWYGSPDFRSYRISFDKVRKQLGFKSEHTVVDGAKEIYEGLKREEISDTLKTRTVSWYKYLLEYHRVSHKIFP